MTVDFADYFWGEKNNGYDVLYHNMKHGAVASKELAEFLKERSTIEENNYKVLSKLAKQAGSSSSTQGTFAPVWAALRGAAEKLAGLHLQMAQRVTELIKDVSKYTDELHKKHKAVKEEESSTLEVVQSIQNITVTLHKAKDMRMQKGLELEKLRKDNASQKELEKAEIKFKKAQDDYKTLVDKYMGIRNDFQTKMTQTCRRFQYVEETHLKHMKEFLNIYADVLQSNHEQVGQVHIDFKRQCSDMTVDKLLEQFVQSKYTGFEKPGTFEYEEIITGLGEMTSHSQLESNVETPKETSKGANGETGVAGNIHSSKNDRGLKGEGCQVDEEKGTVQEKTNENLNERDRELSHAQATKASRRTTSLLNLFMSNSQDKQKQAGSGSAPATPQGNNLPPAVPPPSISRNPLRGSKWFLRSRREKRKEKKAKKKKDIVETSSNKEEKSDLEDKDDSRKSETPTPEVDEDGFCIRPKAEPWENEKGFYSSSDTDSEDERERKIRVEIKPLSNGGAPMSASVDELRATVENLSLSPAPTGRRGSNNDSDHHMKRSQSVSQQLGDGDLFSEVGDITPALPPKQSASSTPTGSIIIPRPPSRRGEGPSPRGRMSPATISRADSVASLEFRTAGVGVGSSRGPSPLTIGLADTIPLAVAFHEIVHSYFRGTDETRCQVKLSGDMMLSFPAGIVAVLANNPSPAKLTFRVRNSNRLEKLFPNNQLVSMDATQTTVDSTIFEFNMSALTTLLRKQAEQNPSASYFNVDILKYQIKCKEGAGSCPFQLVAYWKCETTHTDLKIDYKYNSRAMASPSPLLNLHVAAPIDGGFKSLNSKPQAQWLQDTNRVLWKFTELSQHSEGNGVGSLKARVELAHGPGNQGTIFTQFNCEGTTLSGVEFELLGPGYRLSLVKRRFVSGKYICDGDSDSRSRYAAPPSNVD
ncbi:F-BAR domain only protein 2 isoform X6 [Bombus vancouverensis nearcticus]|uniref:F-BAR domain only protein 2 isoform X7 n=2 Tax=Pyrobombus TaxID=144703 RepID=A0A6P8NAF9_9HYME|nr:F-BAR domain only protein 2 isoform X6 [Bombus impatiens]XP_033193536.1 F-BAR domain only protein 2 isoform X7 [Bombus vancouverensis nearcticus]XP_033311540.1 F-BAR domain only protein 2 isoform X7 [Bombus bifarius]